MDKYKALSDLKEKDIDEILMEIFKCESKNKDDAFLQIWNNKFVNKFENIDALFIKNDKKGFQNPIVSKLYEKFKDFFDEKEKIKIELDKIDKKIKQLVE